MKFTLAEHRNSAGVHWDLLLQTSLVRPLRTFRLPSRSYGRGWMDVEELDPHRPLYLNYTGPVSLSRGWVTPYDRGTFRLLCDRENRLCLALKGQKHNAVLEIVKFRYDQWRMRML